MSTPISSLGSIAPVTQLVTSSSAGSGAGFRSALADAIGSVEQFQKNADSSVGKFLTGEDEEIHKVALATQEASLSFDLFLQVRNKVVSAYQEVMRMQM